MYGSGTKPPVRFELASFLWQILNNCAMKTSLGDVYIVTMFAYCPSSIRCNSLQNFQSQIIIFFSFDFYVLSQLLKVALIETAGIR